MTTQPRGLLDIGIYDAHIRQSAADAARDFKPAAPQIPPLPKAYGLADALDMTGKALDGQNLGTAGLLTGFGIASRSNLDAAGEAIKALDKGFFKWAGRVLTPADEIARGAGDMQRGVPAHVAVPGTALRIGGRLASAAAGAKFGATLGLLGGPFWPVTVPLGGVAGGIFGGWAGDKVLPDRETLGTGSLHGLTAAKGLLNSFNNHAKHPPAGARHGFTGTP